MYGTSSVLTHSAEHHPRTETLNYNVAAQQDERALIYFSHGQERQYQNQHLRNRLLKPSMQVITT